MNVAIIGYGVEGESAYRYWRAQGAAITICDQEPARAVDIPEGVGHRLGADSLKGLDQFDVIMRSAGAEPRIILAENPGVEDKITTVINEFLRVCPTKNVIGVTGTKGKGTTSTLITKMLEAAGKHVLLGGNIGLPPLDFLHELTTESWVVLELSSFQLIDLQHSPHIAVCLMIAPEHMNWHADMDEYLRAKANLFAHQASDDVAIYFAENRFSQQIAAAGEGKKIPYFVAPGAQVENGVISIADQTICRVDELKLLGVHNQQNICAALTAAWQVTQDVPAILGVLTSFSGLPYRLEFVRELGGVRYYNDSFGTTPETAIVAVRAFAQPKVVILGGSEKDSNYDELARAVATNNVRQVILIGNPDNPLHTTARPRIAAALEARNYNAITPGGKSMIEVVQTARASAHPGDVVLLSPACASYDMFTNYKARGNQFSTAVNALS